MTISGFINKMSLTEASDGVPEPCEAVQIITDKKKFEYASFISVLFSKKKKFSGLSHNITFQIARMQPTF